MLRQEYNLSFVCKIVNFSSVCCVFYWYQQCIPTPVAWYLHQMPEWFQKLSVALVYVIEIAIPFLFFSPARSQRLFAFCSQVRNVLNEIFIKFYRMVFLYVIIVAY